MSRCYYSLLKFFNFVVLFQAFEMAKKKNQKSNQKPQSNKKKSAAQIFKVASSSNSSKKNQKKTQEIPKKLKQLDLKTKEKTDQQLKNLHLKMVSKKGVKQSQPIVKKKTPAPNAEKVQEGLNKMIVE